MNQYNVELIPALVWDCPECGIENFVRTSVPEMSKEDKEEYYNDLDVDAGNFVIMVPNTVTCPDCKSIFDATYFSEVVSEDFDDYLGGCINDS